MLTPLLHCSIIRFLVYYIYKKSFKTIQKYICFVYALKLRFYPFKHKTVQLTRFPYAYHNLSVSEKHLSFLIVRLKLSMFCLSVRTLPLQFAAEIIFYVTVELKPLRFDEGRQLMPGIISHVTANLKSLILVYIGVTNDNCNPTGEGRRLAGGG